MIKMIVSDMDGTLLNSQKTISAENKKAIQFARQQGIYFVLATGRIYISAVKYAKELGLDTPIIACNGALVKNPTTGQIICENPILPSLAKKIAEILQDQSIYFHFYTEKDFFTKELKHTSVSYKKMNETVSLEDRINFHIVEDMAEAGAQTRGIMKFVAIDEDAGKLQEIRKKLLQIKEVEVSQSWYNNIEVMVKGVSKGSAMETVARSYGISPEHILSIGDHHNDKSMIEMAGYSVAMDNAEEELKQTASYVTQSNDEDGFAKAIYRFLERERLCR